MANPRHKFLIKLKAFLLICLAIILTLTVVVNITLSLYKNRITQALNNNFFKPITLKHIFYLPPNIIIVKNFSLSENKISVNKQVFTIPVLISSFSLSDLFLNKTLHLPSFYCIGLTGKLSDLFSFTKGNFNQILDFIKQLPRQDLKLSLRLITFESDKNNIYPNDAKGDFNLNIKGKTISVVGSLGENTFSFKGLLEKEQINVENFKLVNAYINSQFWGKLNPNLAEFKGYILFKQTKDSASANLSLLDIDSRIKFAFPSVKIERLDFSINNNPVKITAEMLFREPFTYNLKLFSNFRSLDDKNEDRLKNILLNVSAIAQEDKKIKVNGALKIDFLEHKKNSLPLEKFDLNVEDLVINFKELPALKLNIAKINLFSKTSTNLYNINLENLNGIVYELNKNLKLVKFSSPFYGGNLVAKGQIKMDQFTPSISALIRVKDVDANKLDGLLIHFSKVYGKLSSQMFFINYPQLVFNGSLHIRDGNLDNFEFLKWLAKLFDLPSLKKIGFNTASSDFIADKNGVGMYNMDLDSENVKIKGNFLLKEHDMVSSKMFFSFQRKLLKESKKFTSLLRLLGTKQDLVKFNFQLSGNLHKINFQWLKSDFKDDLQKAIPNFAKRKLEDKLKGLIESINEE